MTNFETNPIDALEGLLAERRRYEGWLAQLEERRATSPAHVVDRVRSDYLGRLEGVTQRLRGRATDLEESAAGLKERIATLSAEEGARRDERAELELRALVGEFDAERAQESMSGCDEAIGRLSAERSGHEHELSRIAEVLALVAAPPPAPSAPPAPPTTAPMASLVEGAFDREAAHFVAAEAPEASEASEALPQSALETRTLVAPEPSAVDELAFLQSVVDSTREVQGEAAAAPVVEPELPAAPTPPATGDGVDFLPPPVLSAPRRPTPLSTSIPPSAREPLAGAPAASTLTPGSIPSFLKDMPTEQVKTLKCQECGTMNYPTEWYCERCGGELAAM